MKILFLGDIFGDAGREAVRRLVPKVRQEHNIDFVIGNCENAVNGMGITPKVAEEFFAVPLNVLTSGNHIFHHKDIQDYIAKTPKLLRPANYLASMPGKGVWMGEVYAGVKLAVINLIGQVFMGAANNPFEAADRELKNVEGEADIILVDMHGEATSEKTAMAHYLDGRVSAVFGTHTHIPTADERVLPKGTAYITDVGMCGPYDSIIGMQKEIVVQKFVTGMHNKYLQATGDARLSGAIVDVEENTGKARSIQRIQEKLV
ncbi:MAG: TIGR00282 family metallophosphoesterase [bacterium]